ncbi:hypothetical protein HN51_033540 [Arachis hypogaea]
MTCGIWRGQRDQAFTGVAGKADGSTPAWSPTEKGPRRRRRPRYQAPQLLPPSSSPNPDPPLSPPDPVTRQVLAGSSSLLASRHGPSSGLGFFFFFDLRLGLGGVYTVRLLMAEVYSYANGGNLYIVECYKQNLNVSEVLGLLDLNVSDSLSIDFCF